MTQLTAHFSLAEFTSTSTGLDNTPDAVELERLTGVAVMMETVRAILGGKPITVTSAFRSEAVNNAVGGVADSDHRLGWAVDFRHSITPCVDAADKIMSSKLVFDQLIHETSRDILHISFNPRLRMQVLTQAQGPGTPFQEGIA